MHGLNQGMEQLLINKILSFCLAHFGRTSFLIHTLHTSLRASEKLGIPGNPKIYHQCMLCTPDWVQTEHTCTCSAAELRNVTHKARIQGLCKAIHGLLQSALCTYSNKDKKVPLSGSFFLLSSSWSALRSCSSDTWWASKKTLNCLNKHLSKRETLKPSQHTHTVFPCSTN